MSLYPRWLEPGVGGGGDVYLVGLTDMDVRVQEARLDMEVAASDLDMVDERHAVDLSASEELEITVTETLLDLE